MLLNCDEKWISSDLRSLRRSLLLVDQTLMTSRQARRNTEFWRGKISKGAHLSEVLGERVWEGASPSHGRDFFKKLEYKSRVCRAFKNNFPCNET